MNSTQLHYREATRLLNGHPITPDQRARGIEGNENWPPSQMDLLMAQVHATLALTTAIVEMTRQANPAAEAVAEAVGVLRPITELRHHAHNAFGSDR